MIERRLCLGNDLLRRAPEVAAAATYGDLIKLETSTFDMTYSSLSQVRRNPSLATPLELCTDRKYTSPEGPKAASCLNFEQKLDSTCLTPERAKRNCQKKKIYVIKVIENRTYESGNLLSKTTLEVL